MYFLNVLRKYKNAFNDPQNNLLRIEIDSKQLSQNLDLIKRKFPNHMLAGVLKSNAYGHGLKEMGIYLDKNEYVSYLVVDSLFEARTLRDWGVKKKIIILGYIPQKSIESLKKIKNVILAVTSYNQAVFLSQNVGFKLQVHIKVDTGMHRQGVNLEDLEKTILKLEANKNIYLEGLATHLADADGDKKEATINQIENWKKALEIYKKHKTGGIFHFSATAGTNFVKNAESNLLRIGIGVYGFDPAPFVCNLNKTSETRADKRCGVDTTLNGLGVKPILSFWAKLVNKRDIRKGESVGYNFTWKAPKNTTIGIIPCGYYEGIPRLLSNKGWVYYKNIPLKIIGTVSMNLTAIDITDVKDQIEIEDEIQIFSDDSSRLNSVDRVAEICNTIPYDILIHLAPTIRRVVK